MLTVEIINHRIRKQMIISYGCFSLLYDKNQNCKCLVVDYFGTTSTLSKEILPSYKHHLFTGKGLGKLIINLIQVIATCFPKDKTSPCVLLKANDDYTSYYEEIGFQKPNTSSRIFSKKIVKVHYEKIPNLDEKLHQYYLPLNYIIDHNKKSFINHVSQSLDNVDWSKNIIDNGVQRTVYDFFKSDDYQEFVNMIHPNLANKGNITIPIGEIMMQIFKDMKTNEYDDLSKYTKWL